MFSIPDASRAGDPSLTGIYEADIRILVSGISHTGVIDGCSVVSQPHSAIVYTEPGEYAIRGVRHWCTGSHLPVITPIGYKRLDLVVVSPTNEGIPNIVLGDPTEHPELPVPPDGSVALAAVLVLPGQQFVYPTHIVDKRVMLPITPTEASIDGAYTY